MRINVPDIEGEGSAIRASACGKEYVLAIRGKGDGEDRFRGGIDVEKISGVGVPEFSSVVSTGGENVVAIGREGGVGDPAVVVATMAVKGAVRGEACLPRSVFAGGENELAIG